MLCHSFKEVESGVDTPSISQIMQEMKCGEEKQRFKKADTILIICKSVFLEFFPLRYSYSCLLKLMDEMLYNNTYGMNT